MKKWLILFTLFFYALSIAAPLQERKIDPPALALLASKLGLFPTEDIIAQTQKYWLRKLNQERWEVTELPLDKRLFVLTWAAEQGLFSDWKPACKEYDKALILGATTSGMQKRLDYLKHLWVQGTRFHEIVWLTGERPLDPRVDDFTEQCDTESKVACIIWAKSSLPEEMRTLPVLFITTPMKGEGLSRQRPNTGDTIITWLKIAPTCCKALFVSDQPVCGYQFAVVKTNLPKEFLFDVVGPGIDPSKYPNVAAITLDSVSRWIYQEKLIK